ncbi:hypothetical protein O0L34_g2698 [Tuta absoluta]|nr:hypothetical protein O0L34_g2698 [Tuta absoluta]
MHIQSIVFLLFGACWAAPADNPIRVDLPVYDQPEESPSTSLQLAQPLEPENHPGIQSGKQNGGIIGNLISQKFQSATSLLGSGSQAFSNPAAAKFREDALPETEGWGSKTLSVKENAGNVVAGIFQPKPIVDTIREDEKYGNTGDKFYAAGRAVVGGASGISNFVNSVLEIPANIFKTVTRAATEKLNNLGGKLIGLNY